MSYTGDLFNPPQFKIYLFSVTCMDEYVIVFGFSFSQEQSEKIHNK